jgi:hypothetical protein
MTHPSYYRIASCRHSFHCGIRRGSMLGCEAGGFMRANAEDKLAFIALLSGQQEATFVEAWTFQ